MAPADTLSKWDHVDTIQDNQEMAICPEPIIIQALDLALAQKVQLSTQSDPLVLRALNVTIFFLSHVFFLVSIVQYPYFCFAPSHEEIHHYLLAFLSYSSSFIIPL